MPTVNLSTRIQSIQSKIKVNTSGVLDLNTCLAIERIAGYMLKPNDSLFTHIKVLQTFLRCDSDGIVGSETITKLENYLSTKLPALPGGSSMHVSKKSLDMLIAFEVSSEAQYNKKYQKPIWPGGESGVTIGIGYDLGFNTQTDIRNAWAGHINNADLNILLSAARLTGIAAKNALINTKNVVIPYGTALTVFHQTTLPSFARRTKKLYPSIAKLPPDAQGALLSLVYNRGESTTGASRAEMKNIIALVEAQNLSGIAKQIRNMKRLWEGKGLPGLIDRREKEAQLVEQASFNILSEDIVIL